MANYKNNQVVTVRQGFFYGYIIVAAAFLIMTVTLGTYWSFGIFFKPLATEFGWSRAITSGPFSLAWVTTGFFTIAIGRMNDIFGPRLVMTICGLFYGTGFLLMSQVTALWQVYLFYGVLIGVGISIFVPLLSTVARWFIQRRTLMSGMVVCGIGLGTLIVPPVGNWLIQAYDWRVSFLILGIAILIINVVAAQLLRSEPALMGQKAYGEDTIGKNFAQSKARAFSLREAINTGEFWIVFIMFLCFGFCVSALQIHIVPYATDLGISATTASGILATLGGGNFVGRIGLGSIGDRIGNKKASMIGLILMLLSSLWLLIAKDIWTLYLFAAVFGLAIGDLATQQSPLVAMLFGLTSHGLIFGVIDMGFTLGSALGPFISGYIFDVLGNYHIAFLINAGVILIGLIVTAFLKRPKTLINKY